MSDRIITLLENLLLAEYLQRDVYETYSFYILGVASGPVQEHLLTHRKEEEQHIATLQRYLVSLGAEPLLKRLSIPDISPPLENILREDLKLERSAVKNYSEAVRYLEKLDSAQYKSLQIDLENILVQEQEHVHDLERWLSRGVEGVSSERS